MEITFVLLLSFFFFSSVLLFILRHFFKPVKQSRALWRTSSYAPYFRIPKICDECCRCLLNVSKRQRSFVKFTEIDKVRQKETITEGGGGWVLNKVLYGDCFTPRSNLLPFYIPFLTQKRYSLVYILFNNFFMRQRAESLESTQEAYQSFSRRSGEQLQPLECSPNQYLDIRTAEACTDCFMTLSKRSMQNLIFLIIVAQAQTSMRDSWYASVST